MGGVRRENGEGEDFGKVLVVTDDENDGRSVDGVKYTIGL